MENAAKPRRMVDGTDAAKKLIIEIGRVRQENLRLRLALKPFADAINDMEDEAHRALQVGGYIPVDMDDLDVAIHLPCTITIGHLKAARAALTTEAA
jgi:hypothetical protein